jgi:UDP-N-acetyl-D-galactosamine dehydrogenase
VKILARAEVPIKKAKIGVLGLSFKQDVPDLRNTKVIDIVKELREYGIEALVHDPLVSPDEALREYGIGLEPWDKVGGLDAVILAVPHKSFLEMPIDKLCSTLRPGGALIDVKSAIDPETLRPDIEYWSL